MYIIFQVNIVFIFCDDVNIHKDCSITLELSFIFCDDVYIHEELLDLCIRSYRKQSLSQVMLRAIHSDEKTPYQFGPCICITMFFWYHTGNNFHYIFLYRIKRH